MVIIGLSFDFNLYITSTSLPKIFQKGNVLDIYNG